MTLEANYKNPYGAIKFSKISNSYVLPHVWIWQNFMQTSVPEGCVIHHLDQNKLNNDILNLVCMNDSDHRRWHATHMSAETKQKIANSKNLLGKHHSEISKKKISENKKGKPWTEARRKAQENKKNDS